MLLFLDKAGSEETREDRMNTSVHPRSINKPIIKGRLLISGIFPAKRLQFGVNPSRWEQSELQSLNSYPYFGRNYGPAGTPAGLIRISSVDKL